ncbi:uncharacterized protein NECHADRAFT_89372 [Fusarium vanettenii 77-13-4]|uniref:Uncharacterized protein n=1 Tax=Fusarium vanettenii (strain ATCC MYA-4622 / CBS 123669 / FGSC 9596 / NRRL 45880 / 77-13-4) TaxID=660122 RepID=C7ZR04_FUSV7|nr:uncharacterized protein NECHADRAFT_89372 [Fusarium vanettenii 77-13-4]EEU33559.1 hypothetical protein NECHADRAFT_89372 [Fusarium vanettenii 77-13-4]
MSKKVFLSFLDEIPDAKLEGFPPRGGQITLYTQKEQNGQNYRLDKQGLTSDNHHNLQIQANKQAKSTSVRKQAPSTVATVQVLEGSDPAVTPGQVRDAFKKSYNNDGSVEKLGTPPKPKPKENSKK